MKREIGGRKGEIEERRGERGEEGEGEERRREEKRGEERRGMIEDRGMIGKNQKKQPCVE